MPANSSDDWGEEVCGTSPDNTTLIPTGADQEGRKQPIVVIINNCQPCPGPAMATSRGD